MKVIFLDFDGVLIKFPVKPGPCRFDQTPCSNLLRLLESDKELNIVISSSWREHGLSFIKKLFSEHGIDESRILGLTGFELLDNQRHRGNRIKCWLSRNPTVTKFVILDDSRDQEPYLDKFIRVSPLTGLTEEDVDAAKLLLN